MTVSVLFARADSVYKTLPGVDVWDQTRDARNWPGGCPVVAHPPCRQWGRLRQFAHGTPEEKALGPWAVDRVREVGGVLEHPAESTLWLHCGLPRPGEFADRFGGWSINVEQFHWGHRAEKATWLYIVGLDSGDLPATPSRTGRPTHCVRPTKKYPRLPSITKPEREHTPVDLAKWLVDLARRCRVRESAC